MDQSIPTAALLVLLSFAYAISGFLILLFRQHFSPLRSLRGPPVPSFFMGNLVEMYDQENTNIVAHWEALYGSAFTYKGFIGGCRLMTTDPLAVAYILGHAYEFPKPDFVRDTLATMAMGHNGLLTVEGETHRKQRKILAPAFSSLHIKSLSPIFWEKAILLRDIWLDMATKNKPVDALSWLSRATLDTIGLAGFGYSFNSLTDDSNELANAFSVIFSTARKFRVMTVLQIWFPFLRRFRRNNETMRHAQATMHRIGMSLIKERKNQVAAELAGFNDLVDGEKTVLGRDLLSVLIRSDMTSIPSQRMSIEEILSQISTFIAGGHETTASAITWCLYALSQSPRVQHQLRTALSTIPADSPTRDDDLARLPYLDWVVRESLRVHAPVTSTMRVASRDDEIPVSRHFIDRDGQARNGIRVKKHDIITIPIQAINKSKAIWGEDAQVFRPERWQNPPEGAKCIPGLYSNILTFLNGNPLNGNRACIGYKFALLEWVFPLCPFLNCSPAGETVRAVFLFQPIGPSFVCKLIYAPPRIKIFLYVLLRDIEFSMDPSVIIEKKVNVVTRPFVKSEPQSGNQMPLQIRAAAATDRSDRPFAPSSPAPLPPSFSRTAPTPAS